MKFVRVIAAWTLLHIVAVTLPVLRLKFWTRVLHAASRRRRSNVAEYADAARWGWSVLRAESLSIFRRRWNMNCLPRSITLSLLLAAAGIPCKLRIGVGLDDAGNLHSHAWVEAFGRPLAERGSLAELTPLRVVFERV